MKRIFYLIPLLFILTACATHSEDIAPTYVSAMQYKDYSCSQIRAELMTVTHKVNEIAGIQDKKASGDAWATGVGVILWPSFFFISHNDQHVQLAELKGQYDALEEASVLKDCANPKNMKETKKKS